MIFNKNILRAVLLLFFMVFMGCGNIKTEKVVVAESKTIIKSNNVDAILENSVTWKKDAQKRHAEIKVNLLIADYMDSYKGAVALRESIPSIEIYNSMKKHGATYGVGPEILVGLSIRESNVSQAPKDSSANCRGMCQISKYALEDFNTKVMWPKYHDATKFYTWQDMYDYDKNIEVAAWYLRWLWDTFDDVNTVEDVLICYNVGHGNLAKYKAKANYSYHTYIIARAQECHSISELFNI